MVDHLPSGPRQPLHAVAQGLQPPIQVVVAADRLFGQFADQLLVEQQAAPRATLPIRQDLDVGDPVGPGEERPRRVVISGLIPEGQVRLLQHVASVAASPSKEQM